MSKDQAAAALGVARSVAAFHLDRLVDDGLLVAEYRRLTGRQGPGAGRPAKLYRRAERGVAVSVPPRRYDLAALLLARAVDEATQTNEPVAPVARRRDSTDTTWARTRLSVDLSPSPSRRPR